jgi:hypothetical protein
MCRGQRRRAVNAFTPRAAFFPTVDCGVFDVQRALPTCMLWSQSGLPRLTSFGVVAPVIEISTSCAGSSLCAFHTA